MKKWTMKSGLGLDGKPIDFEKLGRQFGVSSIFARLLVNRHLNMPEKMNSYLYGGLDELENPYLLKDVEKAAALILSKSRAGGHIRIIGDYDVDGIMSVYILMEGLRICGIQADYRIPHRLLHGYGLNERLVQDAHSDGINLLITCDNGISASTAISIAKECKMQVVITDHHEVPFCLQKDGSRRYMLPPADAIVNTKQEDCPYPMKGICGAYTAFRLVQVLYDQVHGSRREQGVADELLPLVPFAALATVCDVMELSGENRILVREGLKMLPQTKNLGMQALIRACGLEGKVLNSYSFGFILGPCLNSAGRLLSAEDAEQLFFITELDQAMERARMLCDLNQQRKQMTADGTDQAIEIVKQDMQKNERLDDVLVIYLPECHESVAGIIASKVKEVFYRPTIILTDPAEGNPMKGSGIVKGSGRSIPAYSMYEKLSEVSEYLSRFGGHPMAAGLSLKKENIQAFRRALNVHSGLLEQDFIQTISADCVLPFSMLSIKLTEELSLLEPYGEGNENPVFGLLNVQITAARYMGQDNRFLRLTLAQDDTSMRFDAPLFSGVNEFIQALCEKYGSHALEDLLNNLPCNYRMDIMYCPQMNIFRDIASVQIKLVDYKFL